MTRLTPQAVDLQIINLCKKADVYTQHIQHAILLKILSIVFSGKASRQNRWNNNHMHRRVTSICILELASHTKMFVHNIHLPKSWRARICYRNDSKTAKEMQSNVSILLDHSVKRYHCCSCCFLFGHLHSFFRCPIT